MKNKDNNGKRSWLNHEIERRKFLKITSLGAGAIAGGMAFKSMGICLPGASGPDSLESDPSVDIVYSVCLNCHNACGIKCRVKNGTLIKIDGNPYHPNGVDDANRFTGPGQARLNFSEPLSTARLASGTICGKGQAGVQVVYNPYRIKGPLRRVGPRGSGEWESVTWDEALTEIAGGSPTLGTPGLAALQDLTTDIIPSDPGMGKAVNGVVCSPGRIQHGQKEFWDLIWKQGYGTANYRHDHTSICEASRHVANALLSGKTHWKPDILDSQCMIWFGANPLEACFLHVPASRKLVENKKKGGKIIVVDPRLSHTAAKADLWVPVKPGTDAAFAFGMARHIIDNALYNTSFLSAVNGPAAGEVTWTEATHLIRTDANREVNAADVDSLAGTGKVVLIGGTETDTDTLAAGTAAELDAEKTLTIAGNPVLCKTAFRLLKERVLKKSPQEYADICGINASMISDAAKMFMDAAPSCSAIHYRGPAKHTNGTYNAMAIQYLNLLAGNIDHRGGLAIGGGHYHEMGGKAGQVDLKAVNGALPVSGHQITRVKSSYESTAEYAAYGYNAANGHPRRPWFPRADNGNYQEIFPSMQDEYPYGAKAFIAYWNDIPYSTPAAKQVARETLTAASGGNYQVPLAVVFDIQFGELAQYADYILPDGSYLERWGTPHPGAVILAKGSPFRRPVLGQFLVNGSYKDASKVTVSELNAIDVSAAGDPLGATPYYRPVLPNTMMLEDVLIQLGKKIIAAGGACPSIGDDAFTLGGADPNMFTPHLHTAWDWNRNMLANFTVEAAAESAPLVSADVAGMQAIYERGGIFENTGAEISGGWVAHQFKSAHKLFSDQLAATTDSMTGLYFDGLAVLDPVIRDVLDNPLTDDSTHPFRIICYKLPWHAQGRTNVLPWLMDMMPENFVEINQGDGDTLGLVTGDRVMIASANDLLGREYVAEGTALVTSRVRPGVVAIAHSFGHWAASSAPVNVDGNPTGFDPQRGNGLVPNPIMRVDPVLGNVSLQDKIGGSVSFGDTMVSITKL